MIHFHADRARADKEGFKPIVGADIDIVDVRLGIVMLLVQIGGVFQRPQTAVPPALGQAMTATSQDKLLRTKIVEPVYI